MSYLGIYITSMKFGFIFDKILFCIPPHFNRRGIQTIIYTRITTKIVYDIFCFFITCNISASLYSFKKPKISIQLPIIFFELNHLFLYLIKNLWVKFLTSSSLHMWCFLHSIKAKKGWHGWNISTLIKYFWRKIFFPTDE